MQKHNATENSGLRYLSFSVQIPSVLYFLNLSQRDISVDDVKELRPIVEDVLMDHCETKSRERETERLHVQLNNSAVCIRNMNF